MWLVGGDALEVLFELDIKGNETKLKGAYSLKEEHDKHRVFKNRDITLLTRVCIVNDMVFLVVIYGYENWTIEKAEMLLKCGIG